MDKRPSSARDLLSYFTQQLSELHEPEELSSIAMWACEEISKLSRTDIIADKPILLDDSKWERIENVIERLLKDEPIQYIFGYTWFMGREFIVDKNVLIPRPETEELVMKIIDQNPLNELTVLDIGTGSGCIAISLAKERIDWEITSCDISKAALNVARRNSEVLGAEVNYFLIDILTESIPNTYDIIVSNPPYVPRAERSLLSKRVIDFEPDSAIFVEDEDPLIFYRKIAIQAERALKSGGKLYFEIEEKRGDEVMELLRSRGWRKVESFHDIHGKERMISAMINPT